MPTVRSKPQVQMMVKADNKPFDLVIIGGGPAGLTAGLYAKRFMIDTLLIEKAMAGGQITSTELVENYPGFPNGISGMDLGQKFEEQARKAGLDIIFGSVVKIKVNGKIITVITDEHSYSAKAVIIASGGTPKKLGVPGEEPFIGKGVSYCATCDGPFYKDKNVAVVGGGNSALEEALFLTKHAKLVTIIHRRDKLRADKILEDRAKNNPKIFFRLNSIVEEITGDTKIKALKIKDVKTNKTTVMDIDGVFIYAGHSANTDFAKDILKLDDNGAIPTDENLQTNVEGIYAAGDVRKKKIWQVITSAADGAIAANSVKEYLEK
jgi:thioredoxin reductase (NADPH)